MSGFDITQGVEDNGWGQVLKIHFLANLGGDSDTTRKQKMNFQDLTPAVCVLA